MCCGLFAVSVFLLAERVNSYYAYIGWRAEAGYAARYDQGVEDLWWIPVTVWHVVLSIVASFLMHRYLANDRVSAFLRWQAIGLVTLVGWGLTIFAGVGINCLIHGNLSPMQYSWDWVTLISVFQFIAAVFASNVLYGSAIQAASSIDPAVPAQELS